MATFEERLTALEQGFASLKRGNAALKNTNELQAITLRAMATKSELATVRDTSNSVFDAIISQNQFTNERLGDIQTQVIELDGKIVGMQTEMRQSFEHHDGKIVGMQTEMRQGFETVNARFEAVDARLETMATKEDLSTMSTRLDARFDQMMVLLTARADQPEQEK